MAKVFSASASVSLLLVAMVMLSLLLDTTDGERKGGKRKARRNKRGHQDCADTLAEYKLTFHGAWSKEKFPRMYPRYRPHAQWSKLVGRIHNDKFHLYKEGELAGEALTKFAEEGDTRLYDAQPQGYHGVFDTFSCDPLTAGEGKTSTFLLADGAHTKLSFVVKIVPSPDWFVGTDGVELCRRGYWRNKFTINLRPMDAGTDRSYTFTSPNWPSHPREPVYEITSTYPDHPASAFLYPEYPKLPRIAYVTLEKVVQYTRKGAVSPIKSELGSHLVVSGAETPSKTTTTTATANSSLTGEASDSKSVSKVSTEAEENKRVSISDDEDNDDEPVQAKSTQLHHLAPSVSSAQLENVYGEHVRNPTSAQTLARSASSGLAEVSPTEEFKLSSRKEQEGRKNEEEQQDSNESSQTSDKPKNISEDDDDRNNNVVTKRPIEAESFISKMDRAPSDPKLQSTPLSLTAAVDNDNDRVDASSISPSRPTLTGQERNSSQGSLTPAPHDETDLRSSVSFGMLEILRPTHHGLVASPTPFQGLPSSSAFAVRHRLEASTSTNRHGETERLHPSSSSMSRSPTASTAYSTTTLLSEDASSSSAGRDDPVRPSSYSISGPSLRMLRPRFRTPNSIENSERTPQPEEREILSSKSNTPGKDRDTETDEAERRHAARVKETHPSDTKRESSSNNKQIFSIFGDRRPDKEDSPYISKPTGRPTDRLTPRYDSYGTKHPVPHPTPYRKPAEHTSSLEPRSSQSLQTFKDPQFAGVLPSRSYGEFQPEDCEVSEWTEWSPCSKSCGFGVRTRARDVVSHSKNGGFSCPVLEQETLCGSMRTCTWQHFSFLSRDKPETRSRRRRHHHGSYLSDHQSRGE